MHRRHVQACLARACLASETKPQVRGSIRKEGKDRLDIWTLEPGSQHRRCGDSSNVIIQCLFQPSFTFFDGRKTWPWPAQPKTTCFRHICTALGQVLHSVAQFTMSNGLAKPTILAPRVCDSVTCTRYGVVLMGYGITVYRQLPCEKDALQTSQRFNALDIQRYHATERTEKGYKRVGGTRCKRVTFYVSTSCHCAAVLSTDLDCKLEHPSPRSLQHNWYHCPSPKASRQNLSNI